MNNFKVVLLGLMCFILLAVHAQDEPKSEMRAIWIATVGNIDWPKSNHRNNPELQKADLIRMLNIYQSINLNAVFFQVRTECDAFYNSAYEPWSRYLTWAQGDDPGYDPLAFALEEAHKRGIELHAWVNPYRLAYSASANDSYFHETHIYKEHPEWAIEYANGKRILNPGIPEVMSYIGMVMRDMVSKYPVDGVHFDDYFYAYGGTPSDLDADEYAEFGNGMSLNDWRRDNVNQMMDTVYKVIQEENSNIRFGVSPFGIYKPGVPSGIDGMDAYNELACDPLAWLEDESVDYLTPQTYWPTGGKTDFETLANWWSDQCFAADRHFYPGHGIFKWAENLSKGENKPAKILRDLNFPSDHDFIFDEQDNLSLMESRSKGTDDPVSEWSFEEVGWQIDIVRLNKDKNGLGSVFYNAGSLEKIPGLVDYLAQNKYTHPAIVPEMTWKTAGDIEAPITVRTENTGEGFILTWNHHGGLNLRYAIYTSIEAMDSSQIILNANNLKEIVYTNQILLEDLDYTSGANIAITAISPTGKESLPSSLYVVEGDFPQAQLVSPADNITVGEADFFTWQSNISDAKFMIQVSANVNFSTIVFQSDWIDETSLSIGNIDLLGETDYFWRVRAATDIVGFFSTPRKITTGFPENPKIIAPNNLAQNVSTSPKIEWSSSVGTEEIKVVVSTTTSFDPLVTSEIFTADDGKASLASVFEKDSWYYIKIKAINSYGESEFTDFRTFKTTSGTIPEVSAMFPENKATVASFDYFKWESSTEEGTITFQLEIAVGESFDDVLIQSTWMSETEILTSKFNLEGGREYFWRVKAKSEFGESDFSEVRAFTTGYPTRPNITAPMHLSDNVDVQPTISWTNDVDTDSIYIETCEDSDFDGVKVLQRFNAALGSGILSSPLKGQTGYYLRIAAENEYGASVFSSLKYFKTGLGNSIGEFENSGMQVNLLPNRISGGNFRIEISTINKISVSISVYDVLGNYIASLGESIDLYKGINSFQYSSYLLKGRGLYFILIESEKKKISKPLLVN